MRFRETERTRPTWEAHVAAETAYHDGMLKIRAGVMSLEEGAHLAQRLMDAHKAFNDSWDRVD